MKPVICVASLLIAVSFSTGCSRKAAQTAPPPPEVLVTTVQPQDVPRVLERVATLDGFINANINAQVQGYIISRDYKEGSLVKKGDLLLQIKPDNYIASRNSAEANYMSAIAGKNLSKAQLNKAEADALIAYLQMLGTQVDFKLYDDKANIR